MKKVKSIYAGLIAIVVLVSVSTSAYAGPFDSWDEFWHWIGCDLLGLCS